VAPALDELAVDQHQHLVGVADGAETMGDATLGPSLVPAFMELDGEIRGRKKRVR